MWVGTENGLMKIDIKNDKIEALYHDKNDKNSSTNSYITSLEYGINDNNICAGTTYGINVVNKTNLKINHFKSILYDNSFFVYNIELDYLENMWISTKRGIFIYNQKEDEEYELYLIDYEGIKEYNKKENKKLSEEIINNEKLKNNYFVNLSHELRTPINVIISTLQLTNNTIRNKTMTYKSAERYIEIISRNCDNLLKIINDIIDSSKIETGQYKINKKNNDIVYIVEETTLNMSKFIEEKGLSLIIDPEIEEKIISWDETEIERCVINLLGNAVKFTPEGGEIRVYIKEVKNNIEITIEDNGIGISKEDQEFIFKRFSQVEGNGATKASSSGIRLTLVKYIVDLHGGYIKLESELDKGSKFTIGLPDILEDNICENKNI